METISGVMLMCGSSILVAMFVMSFIVNFAGFLRTQLGWGEGD
jgi:hypothetical protein